MNRILKFTCATCLVMLTTSACGDGADESMDPPALSIISVSPGSSVPGCEETDSCYEPANPTVQAGTVVTWNNDDSSAHTVAGA